MNVIVVLFALVEEHERPCPELANKMVPISLDPSQPE